MLFILKRFCYLILHIFGEQRVSAFLEIVELTNDGRSKGAFLAYFKSAQLDMLFLGYINFCKRCLWPKAQVQYRRAIIVQSSGAHEVFWWVVKVLCFEKGRPICDSRAVQGFMISWHNVI